MPVKTKKQKGEKRDAYLVKDLDPLHIFMSSIMGSRTENEALCNFDVPAEALESYIRHKNQKKIEDKYTLFQVICAAFDRTVQERKAMNYFIRNGKFYERKDISIACIAKKKKDDTSEEGLLILKYDRNSNESPVEQMHGKICSQIHQVRDTRQDTSSTGDSTSQIVGKLIRLPKLIYNLVCSVIRSMDRKGTLPQDLADANPYQTTCFITNLGSIGLNASYHHLINFGSNSVFLIIGKKEKKPVFHEDGTFELREFIPLSFTIDERISSGVYFANTIRIFKALLLKPELLDLPANASIDYEALLKEVSDKL